MPRNDDAGRQRRAMRLVNNANAYRRRPQRESQMKIKWPAIGAGIAVIAGLFIWHNNGTERIHASGDSVGSAPFATIRSCADSVSNHDAGVRDETQAHLVNGGFHAVSLDSLHHILGDNQKVAAITHTVIDSVKHDTAITIYYAAPPQADILEHEVANAFAWRHRRALLSSDTARFQTSPFFKACVRHCPNCTGAY